MSKVRLFIAGLSSALVISIPAFAGPDSAPPAAPNTTNSGNGNFGGTEIRREQQEAQTSGSKEEEATEKTVQLSEVPQAARDAAQKELGAAPTEAKVVSGTSPTQYELEARNKSGKETAVHVLANGTIVKKEKD
jgi:hypothetical protein